LKFKYKRCTQVEKYKFNHKLVDFMMCESVTGNGLAKLKVKKNTLSSKISTITYGT